MPPVPVVGLKATVQVYCVLKQDSSILFASLNPGVNVESKTVIIPAPLLSVVTWVMISQSTRCYANPIFIIFFHIFKINFLPNKTRLKLTLTWQFRPSWATDFFRVTSSSASDFRFCGRQVTSEEGHKHDLKSRPPHHGSWRWFLFSWSKWILVCTGHLHHSPFEGLLHHPNWWHDYFEVRGLQ